MSSSASVLDSLYRSMLLTKFFTKGWGKPEHMQRIFAFRRQLADRDTANSFVSPDHKVVIEKELLKPSCRLLEGYFFTPARTHLHGDLLPHECEKAHFQLVLPPKETKGVPVCVQFAGTGDHFFWRRRTLMALPLLEQRGIASIIIENPFYGLRKPKDQLRSSLRNVTDMFVMGACLILESLVLFHYCQREGFGPIVFHGISMGGHMATLGATVIPKPIGVVPCLSWSSASLTFTKGVMTGAIPWDVLEEQLQRYKREIAALGSIGLHNNGDSAAFRAGIEFAQARLDGQKKDSSVAPTAVRRTNRLSSVIPFMSKVDKEDGDRYMLRLEALQFMRGIMDECTHLSNFSVPLDPSLCIAVAAERDAYQPRDGVMAIPEIWLGAQMRIIFGHGHVTSYLIKQNVFRQAIYDSLDKLVEKYHCT